MVDSAESMNKTYGPIVNYSYYEMKKQIYNSNRVFIQAIQTKEFVRNQNNIK